jgi:hypothetical protein
MFLLDFDTKSIKGVLSVSREARAARAMGGSHRGVEKEVRLTSYLRKLYRRER